MNCSKYKNQILNGKPKPELDQHLKQCEECRLFKEAAQRFSACTKETVAPPKELDTIIINEADTFIRKYKKENSRLPFHHHYFKRKLKSYLAAAACGVLVAWLIVLALQSRFPIRNIKTSDLAMRQQNSTPLSWDNLDMDNDFFTVNSDIEINYSIITEDEQ